MRYIIIFILVFLIADLYFLIETGGVIGAGWTILTSIATAVLGARLVKMQGLMTMGSVQSKLNSGQLPAVEMAESVVIFLAGALLMFPGFLSDILGFAALLPPLRRWSIRKLFNSGVIKMQSNTHGGQRTQNPNSPSQSDAIEGEYRDLDK